MEDRFCIPLLALALAACQLANTGPGASPPNGRRPDAGERAIGPATVGRIVNGALPVALAAAQRVADGLPFATGYDPANLTPAVMAEYERELTRGVMDSKIRDDPTGVDN